MVHAWEFVYDFSAVGGSYQEPSFIPSEPPSATFLTPPITFPSYFNTRLIVISLAGAAENSLRSAHIPAAAAVSPTPEPGKSCFLCAYFIIGLRAAR
jgi:hypothetical protein